MKIDPFKVEIWMNEHENDCIYNLTESCVQPFKMAELLDLLNIKDQYLSNLLNTTLDYGDINGSDELKKQISSLYETASPENIAIAQGTINANEMVIMEMVEPNDEIITFVPGYQQVVSLSESLGAKVIQLPLKRENDWKPDFNELEEAITEKTKMVCLTLPNNPTGTMLDGRECNELIEIVRKHDLYLFVDEVYKGLYMEAGGFEGSIFDLYDKAIITSGLSKVFSLPGLRLGWILGPVDFIQKIINRRDYHIISISKMNDALAIEVLKQKEKILARNLKICKENRNFLKEWIQQEPHISNVFTPGIPQLIQYDMNIPSEELALRIQQEKGIFFVPGSCFDQEHSLRLGTGIENRLFREGLMEFSKWLRQFD